MSSSKEMIYQSLESEMLGYKDYSTIPVKDCGEALVPITGEGGVTASFVRADALPVTGPLTYVRQGVLTRLQTAATLLSGALPNAVLDVGYGYRSLNVQKARYAGILATLAADYSGEALLAAAHRQVAMPEIAGHPAGAAVDITINLHGRMLDMGTAMWEFKPDSYTFSPYITKAAQKRRQLLLDCMTHAGFAPFLGEWWHFSFGDKEWAAYYNQPTALYDQIEFCA